MLASASTEVKSPKPSKNHSRSNYEESGAREPLVVKRLGIARSLLDGFPLKSEQDRTDTQRYLQYETPKSDSH